VSSCRPLPCSAHRRREHTHTHKLALRGGGGGCSASARAPNGPKGATGQPKGAPGTQKGAPGTQKGALGTQGRTRDPAGRVRGGKGAPAGGGQKRAPTNYQLPKINARRCCLLATSGVGVEVLLTHHPLTPPTHTRHTHKTGPGGAALIGYRLGLKRKRNRPQATGQELAARRFLPPSWIA
jgi:hypothetical protein